MKTEALFPYILPDVPGAPDITVGQALLLSMIEFCLKTNAWDEIQEPIALVDGQSEYEIETPTGARLVVVKNVWAINRELKPVTMTELQMLIPNWQEAQSTLPTCYNAPRDQGSLTVYPIPYGAEGAKLTIRAVYAPTLKATTLPDALINRYMEPIVSGAKARLMLAPGKSWSNPALAAYHQQQFDAGVIRAKTDVIHDKTQGVVRVKPIRFGF